MSDRMKGWVFFLVVMLSPIMAGGIAFAAASTYYEFSPFWMIPYAVVWTFIWSSMVDADWHMHF